MNAIIAQLACRLAKARWFQITFFLSYLCFRKGPFLPPGFRLVTSLKLPLIPFFTQYFVFSLGIFRCISGLGYILPVDTDIFVHIWSLTVFVNFYHGMICSLSVLLKRMTCIFPTLSRVFKLNSNTVYFSKLSYGWFCTLFARILHRCCEQPMLLDHVLTFCGLSIFTSISSTLSYSFCKKQFSTSQSPLEFSSLFHFLISNEC